MASTSSTDTATVLADKLKFIPRIVTMLSKATSDDEFATPGYLYKEIAGLTYESGTFCQDLLSYLVDRLQKPSYHVKLKVLRILVFLVHNGHPHFRQGLRKHSRIIHDACNFSGPPDPLHGNTPYVHVRSTAQDLVQILFEIPDNDNYMADPSQQTSAPGMGVSNRAAGKMEGFGNTVAKPQAAGLGDTLLEGIKDIRGMFVDQEALQRTERAVSVLGGANQSSGYHPVTMQTDLPQESTKTVPPKEKTPRVPPVHIAGVAGGGWDDQAVASSITDSVTSSAQSCPSLEQSVEKTPTQEQCLVSDVVQNNGAKLLKPSQIRQFVNKCRSSQVDEVLRHVHASLAAQQNMNEVQTMNLLLCLEGIMHHGLLPVQVIYDIIYDTITALSDRQEAAVKAKVRKIQLIMKKTLEAESNSASAKEH